MDIAEERLTTAHGLRVLHTRKIGANVEIGTARPARRNAPELCISSTTTA
jgi:hypothetical protein